MPICQGNEHDVDYVAHRRSWWNPLLLAMDTAMKGERASLACCLHPGLIFYYLPSFGGLLLLQEAD